MLLRKQNHRNYGLHSHRLCSACFCRAAWAHGYFSPSYLAKEPWVCNSRDFSISPQRGSPDELGYVF